MKETWYGDYEYKGFTISSPSEKLWRCFPNWSVEALENYQGSMEDLDHTTIAKAKKWVRDVGVNLKESDYLL